eukprot:tig00020563_g11207.t1
MTTGRKVSEWSWVVAEPPHWTDDGAVITLESANNSDFWRKTSYGFLRDNGHFYGTRASGAFEAVVKVVAEYSVEYDQAGLMARIDEQTWIKCGVEYVEGVQYASAVLTNGRSDWSVAPLHGNPPFLWVRLRRGKDSLEVSYSTAEDPRGPLPEGAKDPWTMLRVGWFPELGEKAECWVGVMACSPERAGFKARFEHLAVGPNTDPESH